MIRNLPFQEQGGSPVPVLNFFEELEAMGGR
jgi:hypothetical protein